MRFPSLPTFIRTLYAFSNTTIRATPGFAFRSIYQAPPRTTVLRSMPNIPFLGALFGSSASNMADNTKYPVQKTDGEWQVQLSPGTSES